MKRWLALLMTGMMLCTLAVAEGDLPEAAGGLIPASARLVERDGDDGLTEYEFRDGDTRYDLLMRGETLLELEIVNPAWAIDPAAQTAEAIGAEALKHLPGAVVDAAVPEATARGQAWSVFLRLDGDVYELETDAAATQVRQVTRIFGAADALTVDALWQKICEAKGQAQLAELSLDYDDGRLIYAGEATLDGARYEFEALADSGRLLEWERD